MGTRSNIRFVQIWAYGDSYISKSKDVQGGHACIAASRVPVWGLELCRRAGHTDKQILENYPGLTSDGLAAAWEYVRQYLQEVENLIRENEEL